MFFFHTWCLRCLLLLHFLVLLLVPASAEDATNNNNTITGFVFNGFQLVANSSLITTDGIAGFTPNGFLRLTNQTRERPAHAFYNRPFQFKTPSPNNTSSSSSSTTTTTTTSTTNATALSFSTTFVFAIIADEFTNFGGHGIVFVIAPSPSLPGALPSQYLGLFNSTTNGEPSNHVVAVELDTIYSSEFGDINNNHVGIDINSLRSVESIPAGYYDDNNNGGFRNLSLIGGETMQAWIEYDGPNKQLNVTLAPIDAPNKPQVPLLSLSRDLSPILLDSMYVGFSSATGSVYTSHYILGWSFKANGQADALDLSKLPRLPRIGPKKKSKIPTIGVPVFVGVLVLLCSYGVYYLAKRRKMFAEVMEDWELNYGPQRLKYKELYIATEGFREKELLGTGGFGSVYRGTLPSTKTQVAVKRVSHESRQGMKEFIAEIVSMGQLRHRNLVPLLGYCRRKGELLLVYDFMPNGSLDKFLFGPVGSETLNWSQRFHIIKGVASGLLYLHEEWEKVVIHRDIKASNVLLDGEMNGRLGDFGLARLYDHGSVAQTTRVVGTIGYLAPELARRGKATKSTDVFAFGAFMLEVCCGRRPIETTQTTTGSEEDTILVEWTVSCWNKGMILDACDPKLRGDYVVEEMELVLQLGLLCSHTLPAARPSMRQVVQFLEGNMPLPPLSSALDMNYCGPLIGSDDNAFSYPSSDQAFTRGASVAESVLSNGR